MNADQGMQLPRSIWDRVNWWSVLTTAVVVTFWAGVQWNDNNNKNIATNKKIDELSEQIKNVEMQGRQQVIAAEGNFKVINTQIGDIPYRMQINEKAISDVNARLDKLIEGFSTKIDKVLDNQGRTDTKVEVVSSQVDDLKKSIANKIVWKESGLFKLPWIREVSLKPCYLPTRPGFTVVKSHYRVAPPSGQTAAR